MRTSSGISGTTDNDTAYTVTYGHFGADRQTMLQEPGPSAAYTYRRC